MEPDVAPGFRRREEDGRAGGRDRFMSSVSAVVSTCRPQRTSEGEDVPDDGGDDGADDGRADAGARVGERPPGRPHARSRGGPSGGVETRLQAGLALERGLFQRRANLDPLLPVADSSDRRNTGDVMVGDATG